MIKMITSERDPVIDNVRGDTLDIKTLYNRTFANRGKRVTNTAAVIKSFT
jgi:hypothetical protein